MPRARAERGTEPVAIEPQVFDLLVYLVQNRDRVVSKDDLIAAVWGGRIVSESTLTSRINAARKAVGDSGDEQRLIRTIARKGVRFVCAVDQPKAAVSKAAASEAQPPATAGPHHDIHFCTAPDGARIAYAVAGLGPPLVKAANWLNHLEYDWQSPIWSHLLHALAAEHRLIRYDERGNGLSDWDVDDISFDAFVQRSRERGRSHRPAAVCAARDFARLRGFHRLCRAPPGAREPSRPLWRICPRQKRP